MARGSADRLTSRYARLRVRPAHRDEKLKETRPEEWLLIEWPDDEDQPTKYWLSTLPETISFVDLVDTTKLRWRIERDYQDLKQEVGLGHYEGRGWRGFHHHATLCIAAYGFLIAEREAIPPSGPRKALHRADLAVPPRGRPDSTADPARTPHPRLHRNHAPQAHRRSRQDTRAMSVLPSATKRSGAMIAHSASVRSVWYRRSARLCCRRVVGVHMALPGQVSAPFWNHLHLGHSTPRTLIGRALSLTASREWNIGRGIDARSLRQAVEGGGRPTDPTEGNLCAGRSRTSLGRSQRDRAGTHKSLVRRKN